MRRFFPGCGACFEVASRLGGVSPLGVVAVEPGDRAGEDEVASPAEDQVSEEGCALSGVEFSLEESCEILKIRRKGPPRASPFLVPGDLSGAKAAFEALTQGEITYTSHGRILLAQTLMLQGRFREAAAQLERDRSLDARKGFDRNGAIRSFFLAKSLALLGNRDEAGKHLDSIERLPDLPLHLKVLRHAALLSVEIGDLERAHRLLRRVESLRDRYPSALSQGAAAQIRGEIELAEGRLKEAPESLEKADLAWDDPSTLRSRIHAASHPIPEQIAGLRAFFNVQDEDTPHCELTDDNLRTLNRFLRSNNDNARVFMNTFRETRWVQPAPCSTGFGTKIMTIDGQQVTLEYEHVSQPEFLLTLRQDQSLEHALKEGPAIQWSGGESRGERADKLERFNAALAGSPALQ